MKVVLPFIAAIIFATGLCSAQSNLTVNIKDCRVVNSFEYLFEFKVFKNDTLILTINPEHDSKQVIENLEPGDYVIKYQTIFQKTESVSVEITENNEYSVDLCLNYINWEQDSYVPFIDKLENGERYSIKIYSQGCFGGSRDEIAFKRESDMYFVFYNGHERLLNPVDIEHIRQFEIELNYMQSYGCTTHDNYYLQYNDEEVSISDGSCSWNGDHFLKKNLHLVKN